MLNKLIPKIEDKFVHILSFQICNYMKTCPKNIECFTYMENHNYWKGMSNFDGEPMCCNHYKFGIQHFETCTEKGQVTNFYNQPMCCNSIKCKKKRIIWNCVRFISILTTIFEHKQLNATKQTYTTKWNHKVDTMRQSSISYLRYVCQVSVRYEWNQHHKR